MTSMPRTRNWNPGYCMLLAMMVLTRVTVHKQSDSVLIMHSEQARTRTPTQCLVYHRTRSERVPGLVHRNGRHRTVRQQWARDTGLHRVGEEALTIEVGPGTALTCACTPPLSRNSRALSMTWIRRSMEAPLGLPNRASWCRMSSNKACRACDEKHYNICVRDREGWPKAQGEKKKKKEKGMQRWKQGTQGEGMSF